MTDWKLPEGRHQEFYQDVVKLIDRYTGNLTALEMLAVASNLVGAVLAHQDRMAVTPAQAMQVVSRNIEAGNQHAIDDIIKANGGNA